ncbi:MAG TPA: metallophosphoesterase [Pyrinomonadaceae bacterium]
MAIEILNIPPGGVPQFDELYVISDLHLGGSPDFQIFNSGAELARLIDFLRVRNPDRKLALLINGDFVDFLAELPAHHFDPAGAVDKLRRIAQDPAFAPVFGALKDFAAQDNRQLVLTLGNHDLEFALPWVRANLLEILTGNNGQARGQITLAFDGAGFRCKIGNATVLCVHGNEVDPWNLADYERIRRLGREVIQGRPIESWIPNAGSQLVIDIMNDLKHKFPFVDLLKPETQAAVPILLALAPDQHDKLRAIGSTVRRLAWDKIRSATGFLGAAEQQGDLVGRTMAATDLLSNGTPNSFGTGDLATDRQQYAGSLLDDAEEMFNRDVSAVSLIGTDQLGSYLGLTSAIMRMFKGADTSEVLREALSDLRKDRSFDPTVEDSTFQLMDEQVGAGIDFIVSGHTHLARAMTRKKQPGWYFNSGTWARLIKLEDRVLSNADEFKNVFNAFKQGTMQALDAYPELVMRRLSVVAIWADNAGTHGELRQASLLPAEPILPEAPELRFTKV